jgi:membrane-bound serine protease (ClpP class)
MDAMRRATMVLAVLAAALSPGVAAAQSSPVPSTPVVVLKVEGAIDRTLMSYLEDRLAAGEQRGAVIVLQLNTSGSLNEDGLALASRVAAMRVPVIAWVGPVPAHASGAGLLLLYAAALGAVAPGSQTGPLDPVDLGHPDARDVNVAQTIRGWLDAHGRSAQLTQLDSALPAQSALNLGVAQVVASSVPDLLNRVDGKTVQTLSGSQTLQTRIATNEQEAAERTVDIAFENMGPLRRTVHAVSSPSMVYFLFVIGLACLAFEVTQPGFGFAGFAGAGMVGLGALGLWAVPPAWGWFALMIGGIGLMAVDVRLRNLGLATAAGLLAFGVGSVLAWHGMARTIWISPWLIGGAILASVLYYGFALTVAIQSRDRIVNTQRGLIGLIGEARGRLAPEGPVYVKGAMWRGRAAGEPIQQGARIRVRGIEGLVLKVEAEADPGQDPGQHPHAGEPHPAAG